VSLVSGLIDAQPLTVYPESLGWRRRKDIDPKSGGEVWETPDGELHLHHGQFPLTVTVLRI
jgi:hypothetical protein